MSGQEQNMGNMGSAPRVTPAAIEANIIDVFFKRGDEFYKPNRHDPFGDQVPDSLKCLTVCVMLLRNGFTVVGTSACASPANYDEQIGRKIAQDNAIQQVWALMGYELRSQLKRLERHSDAELGEALTRMTGYRLGNKEIFRPEDAEIILEHFTEKGEDSGEEGGVTAADTRAWYDYNWD